MTCGVASRTENTKLLTIPIFGILRLIFLVVDGLAAIFFGTCSRGCGVVPLRGCEGLLGFIAVLNFFSFSALVLVVLIRWFTEERAYAEALRVTKALVVIDVALKLADAVAPALTTVVCFPDSIIPPFNNSMSSQNPGCTNRQCPVVDLYALYAVYALLKSIFSFTDIILNTDTLMQKPREWYRLRGTHAR